MWVCKAGNTSDVQLRAICLLIRLFVFNFSFRPADGNSYHSSYRAPKCIAYHIIRLASTGSGDELQQLCNCGLEPGEPPVARLLSAVNETGIGPQGLGGKTTCLGLHILARPTHIAGLPVAVNVSCHVTRHAAAML